MSQSSKTGNTRALPEILNTERLMLRRYRPDDAGKVLQLAQANQKELIREFAQVARLTTLADAQSFVAEKSELWDSQKVFCYGIWHKEEKEHLIGQIQVKNIAWDVPAAELGYFIDRSSQRQGYASESIKKILDTAFHQFEFQRIFVRILPSNRESLLLAKRLGFREEGVLRKAFRCGFGELHDVSCFSIVAGDFRTGVKQPF